MFTGDYCYVPRHGLHRLTLPIDRGRCQGGLCGPRAEGEARSPEDEKKRDDVFSVYILNINCREACINVLVRKK